MTFKLGDFTSDQEPDYDTNKILGKGSKTQGELNSHRACPKRDAEGPPLCNNFVWVHDPYENSKASGHYVIPRLVNGSSDMQHLKKITGLSLEELIKRAEQTCKDCLARFR